MASGLVLVACVVLWLLTIGALAASIVVLVTNQFTSVIDGSKTTFKDVNTYRYVLSTAVIGCFYGLIQLPFAIYYAYKGKRLIRNDCLPKFDFYGDKLIALLLASGVGAGLAVSFEMKRIIKAIFEILQEIAIDFPILDVDLNGIDEEKSKSLKFLDKAYIATGLLLLGCLCVALLSVFSSINRSSSSKGFFG